MVVTKKCPDCKQPIAIGHSDFCPTTPIYADMCKKTSPSMISGSIQAARIGKPTGRIIHA